MLGALAGCQSFAGSGGDASGPAETATSTDQTGDATVPETANTADPEPLTVQTTATLWEAVEQAAGLWNANPSPADDSLAWDEVGERPDFDGRLADHFAGAVGFPTTDAAADPPFGVVLEPDIQSVEADPFVDGTVDIGLIDGPDPESDSDRATLTDGPYEDAVPHQVGRDGWVFVVSPAVAEAGVDALTTEEIYGVYQGEISNWRELGGPDAEPFVFLGADVNGFDPAYERFFKAGGAYPVELDARLGQDEELVRLAHERDDAIGVVHAGGVWRARERGVPTLDVLVDGERYSPYDGGYPMTTAGSLHTLGDPDPRERAFLDLLTSPFGQLALVGRELLPLRPVEGW
jgi:phosphate transport system substrate-binding protein